MVLILTAVRLRREIEHEWMVGIAGLLSIAFGVFLLLAPGAGALVVTSAIGWFATLYGVMLVVAWEARRETRAPRTTARPGTPHAAT